MTAPEDSEKPSDDNESEEAGEGVDESTTSSGSDELEEVSTSEAESSSDEEELSGEGARTSRFTTAPSRESNLQSRLQEFLPQLQQANAELDGTEDIHNKRIDEVSDDAEHYIEMDLGLGVLTEQEHEAGEVKIPEAKDQEDYASDGGADEVGSERSSSDSLTVNKVAKRKIEELE